MSEDKKQIFFKLSKIETVSFMVDPTKVAPKYRKSLKFDITLEFKMNPTKNHLIFSLEIISYHKNKLEDKVGALNILVVFTIKNIDELIASEKNGIVLPEALMITLTSIVISTARGIWSEKVRGTSLQNIIMPLINPRLVAAGLIKPVLTNK